MEIDHKSRCSGDLFKVSFVDLNVVHESRDVIAVGVRSFRLPGGETLRDRRGSHGFSCKPKTRLVRNRGE